MNIKSRLIAEYFKERSLTLEDIITGALRRASILEEAREQTLVAGRVSSKGERNELPSQTLEMDTSIRRSRNLQAQLRSASERIKIAVPVRKEGACIVHGRVVDETGRGITGYEVIATSERAENLGSVKTGSRGYFKLEIGHPGSTETTKGRVGRSRIPRIEPQASAYQVLLKVVSEEGKTVYQEIKPISIVKSGVIYREIVIRRD